MPDASENVAAFPLPAAVGRLTDALASATSADDIFRAALEGLRSAVGVDRAAILLTDADAGDGMRFKASLGLSDDFRRAIEGHTPWTSGEPAPIVIADVAADPALAPFHPALARENIRALAWVPLVLQQQTIGTLMLCWQEPHEATTAELAAALTLAAFVSLTVPRTRQHATSLESEQRMNAALQQEAEARQRLSRLAKGSQRLQESLEPEAVLREVLALAKSAIAADGYALWRKHEVSWRMAASSGLDPVFTAIEIPDDPRFTSNAPFVVEDIETASHIEGRRDTLAAAGIRAFLSIPLQIRGRIAGGIAFYFHQRHHAGELELRIAQALGPLAASAISAAELFAEQQTLSQRAMRAAERAEYLAHISARLTSLDHERNITAIVTLVVPRFADWCVVDLLEGGDLRRLASSHADPATGDAVRELERRYPPRRDASEGVWHAIRTGEPALFANIDDRYLEQWARSDEHRALLERVGPRSAMLLPLKRGDDVFGLMMFVRTTSDRRYDVEDFEFAQEVARRASYSIENSRLYRQAQDASRAKDDFLAALSHELRTPLNAILGWASILRARPDGAIERGLDVIYRNAVVQTQLVDDLLDASRIVTGRMSFELRDVPLRPILESAIETVLPQATEKAIELQTALPEDDILIRGDASRLQQVFWNVLANAVKFTPRGGRISVRTEVTPAEIAIHVDDTGAGIRPEALPHIFDRFKQADGSTTTRRFRGLGLGLTLSRQLTEMHGGRIAAFSAGPGLGATFTVALPLVERQAVVVPRAAAGPGPTQVLEGFRIVAVDDDPDSLEMLLSLLRAQNATVLGAASAIEALELVQKERPDVVISDIAMPDHDGYWLMEQLRRLATEGGPRVPCVALTAFANQTVRERALATGFIAHLSKPFDPDQLVDTLHNAQRAGREGA